MIVPGDLAGPVESQTRKGNDGHSGYERHVHDWYIEADWCVRALFDVELFPRTVWDPCCGGGQIPRIAAEYGYDAMGSDLIDRGSGWPVRNFLDCRDEVGTIVMNPPFRIAREFIDHALRRADKVAVMARLAFLEGERRHQWWNRVPLRRVWVSSKRISMPPGGMTIKAEGGKVAYAWFVFERDYRGAGEVRFLPYSRAPRNPRDAGQHQERPNGKASA